MKILLKTYPIIWYVLLVSVLVLSGCVLDNPSRKIPTNSPDIINVEVDSMHQTCELTSDCVLVYADCSGCDCGVPVNYFYEDYYVDLYEEICSDYEGPVCEMYCPPSTLICQSGFCGIESSE